MSWRLSSALREERKGQGGSLCLCGLGVISGQEEPAAGLLRCCNCTTPGMRGEVERGVCALLRSGRIIANGCVAPALLTKACHVCTLFLDSLSHLIFM